MTLQANNPVAPLAQQEIQDVPLKIVGGSNFGRYSKISAEKTFNMIVSDGFLVPYSGYEAVGFTNFGTGRGIHATEVGSFMLGVIGNKAIRFDFNGVDFTGSTVGTLLTTTGDVYITENNNKQMVITDGAKLYVYNYNDGSFKVSTTDFTFPFSNPGYCSFQNGRVIVALLQSQEWALSGFNDALIWLDDAQHVGQIQTKPGYIQAAVPLPGGGNNLLIFGINVSESWQDLGLATFPYQRNSSFNIDYGVTNASSIDDLDNFIVWISTNETSGPTVMVTSGNGAPEPISTDGIDFQLAALTNPSNVTGFLFRQDGHLIYQFTFPDDNVTFAYDFETKLFFNITDYDLSYHPAREVVFFNNSYYFLSLKDGNLYLFDTTITNMSLSPLGVVHEIPRIRITPPLRLPSQRQFIARSVGFIMENGQLNPVPRVNDSGGVELIYARVDLSASYDGGESFGSNYGIEMNLSGNRKSRMIWQGIGIVNDATFQFRFYGLKRFVVGDGVAEVYQ